MNKSTKQNDNTTKVMPFELFYLCELLAEEVITKDLFDRTYNKLLKELNLSKEKMELEL